MKHKPFAFALTVLLVVVVAACQVLNGQTPDKGLSPTKISDSISVSNEFGEIQMLTTNLSVVEGERPALPTYLTSYSATRFEVGGYLCYKEDYTPIYAEILPAYGQIQPGERIQLYLLGNDDPQKCSGTLVIKLYDDKDNMKQISIPVEVEIRPKQ